jgi:putative membrane protein
MKTFPNQLAPVLALMGFAALSIGMSQAYAADGPSDAQIVGIVLTADDLDVSYGRIALKKSKNKAVREFAQRMVTDHSAVQQSVMALAAKLGVTAADSPTRDDLTKGGVDVTAKLKSLRGKAFDDFYVNNEVDYHTSVTGAVDSVLIPSAQNAELKTALEGAKPLFLKHLEHAKMIQTARTGMSHSAMSH